LNLALRYTQDQLRIFAGCSCQSLIPFCCFHQKCFETVTLEVLLVWDYWRLRKSIVSRPAHSTGLFRGDYYGAPRLQEFLLHEAQQLSGPVRGSASLVRSERLGSDWSLPCVFRRKPAALSGGICKLGYGRSMASISELGAGRVLRSWVWSCNGPVH
jgi:hypothetical protein